MASIRTRPLGTTGVEVPELGLGAMDTPTSPEGAATIDRALDLGVMFIDTAREYAGSEMLLGQVLRERGAGAAFLASKTFSHSINGSQWDIDRSLQVLGVPRIDLYQLHDISSASAWDEVVRDDGALAGLQTAQYRGLIGHIGISCHDLDIAREAILSGHFATIMLEYSAFYTDSAPLIDLAAEQGVGVIVMRPVGGSGRTSAMRGRIADGYAGPLTPANLLRYVLSNPAVSVAIPGARFPSRIDENVASALSYTPFTAAEKAELEAEAATLY
ncbi:MAG: aldo/keto reductase [Tepidiformaceae bacterium]